MTQGISRREILGMGVATGLVGCRSVYECPCSDKQKCTGDHLKNIIFMVADGMNMGVPSLGEPFSRIARNKGTYWYELTQSSAVVHSWQEMASLNSLVTDSEAASSSWGRGGP